MSIKLPMPRTNARVDVTTCEMKKSKTKGDSWRAKEQQTKANPGMEDSWPIGNR